MALHFHCPISSNRPIVDASVKIETTPAVVDITQPCSRDDIQGACFTVELCLTGTIRGGGTWDNSKFHEEFIKKIKATQKRGNQPKRHYLDFSWILTWISTANARR